MFNNESSDEKWAKAKEYTKNLDEIRNQNIEDYLPEFKGKM